MKEPEECQTTKWLLPEQKLGLDAHFKEPIEKGIPKSYRHVVHCVPATLKMCNSV